MKHYSLNSYAVFAATSSENEVSQLERFRLPEERERELLEGLRETGPVSELVYLATCNRVELYFKVTDPEQVGSAFDAVRRVFSEARDETLTDGVSTQRLVGRPAVRHLLRVASSLDSMVVGEHEIIGQVKEAWKEADEEGLAGNRLRPLFDTAFRTAKVVRRETELFERPVSVASLGVNRVHEYIEENGAERVGVVGAGEMSELAIKMLSGGEPEFDLLWINRTLEKLSAARHLGAEPLALSEFIDKTLGVDVLVTATSSEDAIFDPQTLNEIGCSNSGLMVLDLAVPRDVEPEADELPGLELLDIDSLREQARANRDEREREAQVAEQLVEEQLTELRNELAERSAGPAIEFLHKNAQEICTRELEEAFDAELSELDEEQADKVRQFARNLTCKVLHYPMVGLRNLASNCALSDSPELLEHLSVEELFPEGKTESK